MYSVKLLVLSGDFDRKNYEEIQSIITLSAIENLLRDIGIKAYSRDNLLRTDSVSQYRIII